MCEVVHTLQLSSDREPRDVVGDLSVCLDGMQVDPETFASAETTGKEHKIAADSSGQIQQCYWCINDVRVCPFYFRLSFSYIFYVSCYIKMKCLS